MKVNEHQDQSYFQNVIHKSSELHFETENIKTELKKYSNKTGIKKVTVPELLGLSAINNLTVNNPGNKVTIIKVAKLLSRTPANMTRIIDALDRNCFVERVLSKEDRRAIELVITDKGKEFLKSFNKFYYFTVK